MKFSTKTLAFALLATGGATVWACSSSDKDTGGSSGGSCTQNVLIQFSPMYSAVVEGHTTQVPVILTLDGKEIVDPTVTWTTSDSASTSLDPDTHHAGGRLVTVKAAPAGTVSISGTYQGCTKTSALTVSSYTAAQYETGSKRYNTGASGAANNGQLTVPDGGVAALACADPVQVAKALQPAACINCHGSNALGSVFFKNIEHTPEQTGGFSDADLKNIILNGTLPQGFTIDTSVFIGGTAAWGYFHKWQASEEEVTGLIAYLRTLTPAPQDGSFDFAGLSGASGGDGGLPTSFTAPDCGADAATLPPTDSGAAPVDAGTTATDAAAE